VASGSGEPEDKGAEAQGFFSAVSTLRFQLSGFILPLLMLCISGASAQVTNTNTVVSGGTIGAGTTSLITNPVTNITGAITNNGWLNFVQTNSTVTDPFAISGTGSLTQAGSGTLVLAAAETFTGALLINSNSAVQLGTNGTIGSLATTNITVNGNLIYSLSGAQSINDAIRGSGSVTFSGTGTYTYTGTNNASNGTIIDTNATLSIASGGVFGTNGKVVDNGRITVTTTATISNNISGSGSLTASGGTVTLTGSNSFTGPTTITGTGYLTLSNTSGQALYNGGSGTIVINAYNASTGGLLFGANNQLSSNVDIVFNPASAYGGLQLLGYNQTVGNLLFTGATPSWIVIENSQGTALGNGTLTFYQTTNQTFGGYIRDLGSAGNLSLVKMGAATFTFNPVNNSYSGTTTIGQGVIAAGAANALSPNSAFTLSNAAGVSLNLNGFNNAIDSLAGGGSLGGNVLLGSNGVLTFGNTNNTTFAGVISGSGSAGITKNGTGTFTLLGNNTYTGTTTISAGTVQVGTNGTNGSLGTGGVALSANSQLILNMGINQF
jgi:autotransporter-associated beta strand protein